MQLRIDPDIFIPLMRFGEYFWMFVFFAFPVVAILIEQRSRFWLAFFIGWAAFTAVAFCSDAVHSALYCSARIPAASHKDPSAGLTLFVAWLASGPYCVALKVGRVLFGHDRP